MKFIVAWIIAITSPSYPDYNYVSILFNDKTECQEYKAKLQEKTPLEVSCQEVALMAPTKQ